MQQPGEGDLGDRAALRLRDRPHRVDHVEGAGAIDRREVEIRPPSVRSGAVAAIFAAEEAAGERAPHHQSHLFGGQLGTISRSRSRPAIVCNRPGASGSARDGAVRRCRAFGNVPSGPVRHADIAHVALTDVLIEGFERFLDRRQRVEAVDLVEVDVVELKPLQARLRLIEYVTARSAAGVRRGADAAEHLRRDDHLVPGDAEIAQRLTVICSERPSA